MENAVEKKRILSGIQPSGDLTLGSYLGAIRNWAAMSDEYDCYYMLADMHTITVRQVPADLRRHTLTQVAAVGLPAVAVDLVVVAGTLLGLLVWKGVRVDENVV